MPEKPRVQPGVIIDSAARAIVRQILPNEVYEMDNTLVFDSSFEGITKGIAGLTRIVLGDHASVLISQTINIPPTDDGLSKPRAKVLYLDGDYTTALNKVGLPITTTDERLYLLENSPCQFVVAKGLDPRQDDICFTNRSDYPTVFERDGYLNRNDLNSYFGIPIYIGSNNPAGYEQVGIAAIMLPDEVRSEVKEEMQDKLEILASMLSTIGGYEIVSKLSYPIDEIDRLYSLIDGYLFTLERRTPETVKHDQDVALLVIHLLDELMGSNDPQLAALKLEAAKINPDKLYFGALLHDIGKLMVPPKILNKPDKLTEEEYEIIKRHPMNGIHLLRLTPRLLELVDEDAIIYHQEAWGGGGYPFGLKGSLEDGTTPFRHTGEEYDKPKIIPLSAQITQICDIIRALTESRPYATKAGRPSEGMNIDTIKAFILKNQKSDTDPTPLFNPLLIGPMLKVLDSPKDRHILFNHRRDFQSTLPQEP